LQIHLVYIHYNKGPITCWLRMHSAQVWCSYILLSLLV